MYIYISSIFQLREGHGMIRSGPYLAGYNLYIIYLSVNNACFHLNIIDVTYFAIVI